MGKAVPVNKNSNAATMNAVVKYFSWNMKKCLLSRSKRTSGRDGNERCRCERYGQSTQNCKRYCFRSFKKTKNFPKQVNINIWMNFLNCFPNSISLRFMPITISLTAAEFHPTNLLQEREIRNKLKEII